MNTARYMYTMIFTLALELVIGLHGLIPGPGEPLPAFAGSIEIPDQPLALDQPLASQTRETDNWVKTPIQPVVDEQGVDLGGEKIVVSYGHQDRVLALCFSPDGRRLATGSSDKTVRIRDIVTGEETRVLSVDGYGVDALQFTPDGKLFAAGASKNYTGIWDVQSGKEIRIPEPGTGKIHARTFSPDGKLLCTCSRDNGVNLWDAHTGKRVRTIPVHDQIVKTIRFSPDGRLLVTGSGDNVARVWDVSTGDEVQELIHDKSVRCLRFHPGGKLLATGQLIRPTIVWNIETGKRIHTLLDREARAAELGFSPDGLLLATHGKYGEKTVIWDIETSQPLRRFERSRPISFGISFNPDGTLLAVGEKRGETRLWNIAAGRTYKVFGGSVHNTFKSTFFSFNKYENRLTSITRGEPAIRVWDLDSNRLLYAVRQIASISCLALGPDGDILATGSKDGYVRLGSLAGHHDGWVLRGSEDEVRELSFSPDGERLAVGDSNGAVNIRDTRTGREVYSFSDHHESVQSLHFSPDGKFLAAGFWGGLAIIRNLSTGDKSPLPHAGKVTAVRFSPDGELLATGSNDGIALIWNAGTAEKITSLEGLGPYLIALSFSSDGKRLFGTDVSGNGITWAIETGEVLKSYPYKNRMDDTIFSPSGEIFVTTTNGRAIQVKDTATNTLQSTLYALPEGGWISHQASGKLLHGSDGLQVRLGSSPQGDHEFLKPPRPRAPSKLRASIDGPVTVVDGRRGGRAEVLVANVGDGPAYFVRLLPDGPPPAGFLATIGPYISRLNSGEARTIQIDLSHLHTYGSGAPGPMETRINFKLVSLYTEATPLIIQVTTEAPRLVIEKTEILTDDDGRASALLVNLDNMGNAEAGGASVVVEFLDGESGEIMGIQRSDEIKSLPGQSSGVATITLPESVRDKVDEVEAHIRLQAGLWPSHRWESVVFLKTGLRWFFYGSVFLSALMTLVILFVIRYNRIHKHPMVKRLTNKPDALFTLPASSGPEVDLRMRRAGRLKDLLQAVEVPESRWNVFRGAAAAPVQSLARVLGLDLADPVSTGSPLTAWHFDLPDLPFTIERKASLLILEGHSGWRLPDLVKNGVRDLKARDRTLFLIDMTPEQKYEKALEELPFRVTVLNDCDLTSVLLAGDPIKAFSRIIGRQADLSQISPYQTGGGIDSAMLFFGRRNEMALLTDRQVRNHFLVGARQMGKTSLLKELKRRFSERAYYVPLRGNDLESDMESRKLPPLKEIIERHKGGETPFLLMDECDQLVASDRANDYRLLHEFRALSEAGLCRFVLSGFWELYRSAFMEHHSPILNFAEPLLLEPLDEEAARALAVKPLEMLGIRFASDALISDLLRRTGRRPNLIARVCDAALRGLSAMERVIDAENLRAVMDMTDDSGKEVRQAFFNIGELTPDKRASVLDRMVMYATMELDAFTIPEVMERLKAAGASPSRRELQKTMERLTLAYVLKRTSGRYIYPIPLLVDFLMNLAENSPLELLAGEADSWKQFNGDSPTPRIA
ncbi:MAG: hypothetical protein GY859_28885 [Desulfobacterales bacterium]|nr:hypothetical protein [Desulfobacterales bacterium]